jgi:hypothetical protein
MKMCDKLLQTWQGLKTDLGYYVHFPNTDEIFFTVTKNVIIFDYSARVELEFKNGIFISANVTGWGIK